MIVAGLVVLCLGLGWAWPPLGVSVAGLALIVLAVLLGLRSP